MISIQNADRGGQIRQTNPGSARLSGPARASPSPPSSGQSFRKLPSCFPRHWPHPLLRTEKRWKFKQKNDEFVTRHRCVKDLLVGFEAKARVSDCTKSSLPYWSSRTLTQNDFSLSFGGAICRRRKKSEKKPTKNKSVSELSPPPPFGIK